MSNRDDTSLHFVITEMLFYAVDGTLSQYTDVIIMASCGEHGI